MVNLKEVVKGQCAFFIGYFYLLIVGYIVPPLINVGEALFTKNNVQNTDIQAIAWLLAVVFFLFVSIIIPMNYMYKGLTESDERQENNKFLFGVLGIFIFFIGIILTVKAWYMITAFTNILSADTTLDTTMKVIISAMFWMGLLLSWVISVVITPIVIFVQIRSDSV